MMTMNSTKVDMLTATIVWMFKQEAQGARFELVNDGDTLNVWHQPWTPEVEQFWLHHAALAHDLVLSMPVGVM